MRYVRLVAVSDEYDTEPGLALKGAPVQCDGFMADRDGSLIAHDLLEHVNGREHIGTVWDELEALGAIWQVRGRHGDLAMKRPNVHSQVASDLTRMFRDWCGEGAPPSRHRLKRTRAHDYDEDFRDIIAIARHDIPREFDEDFNARERAEMDAYLREALHRMRAGFRKAQRKYGTGYEAHATYCAIRDAVASATIEWEGQEFTLGYGDERAFLQECY